MKKFLAAIGAFFTFVTLFAQSPKKVEDLAGFRQIYENRVTQIDQKYLELLTKAPAVYANALTVMEQAFTKKRGFRRRHRHQRRSGSIHSDEGDL